MSETLVTLRDHLESQIKSLREYMEARLDGIDRATRLEATNMQHKLEGMNEWRSQSKDEKATFITRPEGNAITNEMKVMANELAELRGKASQKSLNMTTGLAVIGVVVAIISIIISFMK